MFSFTTFILIQRGKSLFFSCFFFIDNHSPIDLIAGFNALGNQNSFQQLFQ